VGHQKKASEHKEVKKKNNADKSERKREYFEELEAQREIAGKEIIEKMKKSEFKRDELKVELN
jgi:hypothetical protein